MSATSAEVRDTAPDPGGPTVASRIASRMMLLSALAGVAVMSIARIWTDNPDLTSSGTFGVALRTAMPIAMAGLAGLYAERSGTVNIGIEGMMIMGTIFAGWWGWSYGPWMAMVGGLIGGMLGGLLHAVATVTFGVNHIVSGFAINIIAPGVARFMANELFTGQPGGSVTNSPGNDGDIGSFTMPFLSGGEFFGWTTPDPLGWIEEQGWFVVSDIAGLLGGLTTDVTYDVMIGGAFLVLTWYLLWRTPVGLRLRSSGERPSAADSLGVGVYRVRYLGMAISGAMAGFGGAILVLFANRYQEGQTGGRGFLGLATLIVGNWRPLGLAAGAGLFGYFQGITLRPNPDELVRSLILAAALMLLVAAAVSLVQRRWTVLVGTALLSAAGFFIYMWATEINNQFVYVMPYLVTLIVVSVGGQRLRPPAQAGIPWRKGSQL